MGDAAGVGIEPIEQTKLLDATLQVPGVLCVGVPGAGGVDAVFALVLSLGVRETVETLWASWTSGGGRVCPLMLSADFGERAGVRIEGDMKW